ncbi:DUF1177 domain-containing protein [Agrococcus sp. SGAir0287]|uniref:DUF1177 domain-containing protein n=1 Tax=Agrococcus sp. SGAir0287 TaxID=2070347 RepID=UPI001C30C56C|nr:DUF1177 domain-containing protein [Agrococcus sp. SGAir0287]
MLQLIELIDSPAASGERIAEHLRALAPADASIEVEVAEEGALATDFVRVTIPGTDGRSSGGSAPTLGIVGRLGGVGARPELIGMVSDADGAVAALAAAAKLLHMASLGDRLPGDVVVSTHVDPDAPTEPHDPVPFMSSAVDIATMNAMEVSSTMDAIVSIDTTKGNRILNHRGIALSPTVRQGYILRPAPDLVEVVETVTGEPARVLPLAQQDITPYGNGLHHLNSILQPAVATHAPVVGLALTTVTPVAGCATGASHETDIAAAARFALEVAKGFGAGRIAFHDEDEFERMTALYGGNERFQTLGREVVTTP